MASSLFLSCLLLLPAANTVLARPGSCQAPSQRPASVGKAIYLITNDQQNAVAAIPISADGQLSGGTLTPTGGSGANSIDGSNNQPAVPDALVSQSALTLVGNAIFAVNAGSNSLSMLVIDPQDPTKLTVLGQPVDIPGEFPNTVAASGKNNLVCVGTTGAVAGISCSTFSNRGLGPMDALRPFDLGQTTPPVGPTNTVSQAFFSEDEGSLFVTVKGDPAVNNTGFLSVFPVESGCQGAGRGRNSRSAARLSTSEKRSSPEGTAVLFGSAVIPGSGSSNNIFATDASFGAAVLSVDATGEATLVSSQAIADQKATCWATVSSVTNTAFVTDVGVNRVVEMNLADASIVDQIDLSETGDPGLIDLRAAGNFLYTLSPGNGTGAGAAVSVLDISGGPGTAKLVQHFVAGGIGVGANSMGMAVLI